MLSPYSAWSNPAWSPVTTAPWDPYSGVVTRPLSGTMTSPWRQASSDSLTRPMRNILKMGTNKNSIV